MGASNLGFTHTIKPAHRGSTGADAPVIYDLHMPTDAAGTMRENFRLRREYGAEKECEAGQ
jgi:hypothetical protein